MFLLSLLIIFFVEPDKTSGVRSPERPVVPNVTALSSTEVRITWCRVNSNKVEIDHYELYIDTQLEYSGVDVIYIAKRLKPWSWYEVKLRACGFSPGSCSPFSRPALVKTMQDGDNTTTMALQSGVSIFQTIVVPTYTFILGMIAGILAISFIFTWRYLQNIDLSEGSEFVLPQYETAGTKDENSDLTSMKEISCGYKNILLNQENMPCLLKVPTVDDAESRYFEILPVVKCKDHIEEDNLVLEDFLSDCDKRQGCLHENKRSLQIPTGQLDTHCTAERSDILSMNDFGSTEHIQGLQSVVSINPLSLHGQDESLKNGHPPNTLKPPLINNVDVVSLRNDKSRKHREGAQSHIYKNPEQFCESDDSLIHRPLTSDLTTPMCQPFDVSDEALLFSCSQTLKLPSHLSDQEVHAESIDIPPSSPSEDIIIVAIDNSNIFIGAQECASMINVGDRKRHVRVKLQNLVKILEKERPKTRGFASGSSPPATEHVWDVYRRLGYIVDLEDRRGKDEQRVDEGLHLWIYKALCELSPGVLVLATGDGMKGKSECDTSFPGCAVMALERGWTVELYSWKHSLSSEWVKLAKKYPDKLTIDYLDKYVNYITFVDGKKGRKCSPLPSEASALPRKPNMQTICQQDLKQFSAYS